MFLGLDTTGLGFLFWYSMFRDCQDTQARLSKPLDRPVANKIAIKDSEEAVI